MIGFGAWLLRCIWKFLSQGRSRLLIHRFWCSLGGLRPRKSTLIWLLSANTIVAWKKAIALQLPPPTLNARKGRSPSPLLRCSGIASIIAMGVLVVVAHLSSTTLFDACGACDSSSEGVRASSLKNFDCVNFFSKENVRKRSSDGVSTPQHVRVELLVVTYSLGSLCGDGDWRK